MTRINEKKRLIVRERAQKQCEYCRIVEKSGVIGFQADHIIPPMHGGADEIENLAWACFRCNNRKGTNIASIDFLTNVLTALFNPRVDGWEKHFGLMTDGKIYAKTASGRCTLRLLDMNTSVDIDTRYWLIKTSVLSTEQSPL
jgi:hypothetical protein